LYLLPRGISSDGGWGVSDTDDLEFSNLIMTLNSQGNHPTACLHRITWISL